MREVPIKWVFRGDRFRAAAFMRRGAVLMDMLESFMGFQGLKQGVLRRWVTPDTLIECDMRFGLRTVTITCPGGAEAARRIIRDCFANRTVALAYVLAVVGLEPDSNGVLTDMVYDFGIVAYPEDYYCTMGIRYEVVVCDGQGEYLAFAADSPSTDFTPHRPGEQVLVMQHRTSGLPEGTLTVASPDPNADPYGGPPFTPRLRGLQEESVSILPYAVNMPRVNENEI